MTMTDPIADMLTRLRNAGKAHKEKVEMPASRLKNEIARIMCEEGYIKRYEVRKGATYDTLVVYMKYESGKECIMRGIKRISSPGLRIYAKKDNLPRVLGGLGVAIISTSQGLMTDREAERKGVGGEVICYIW
ncbi:MAG: 30S ribosomal protein S8 [Actinomycetota bacterium]|nr:30S ribosomal protein S8 [Actinomycetota bacterium]